MSRPLLQAVLAVTILLTTGAPALARLDYNVPRAVVLYDGSRSMYPGYRPRAQATAPRPACFHERNEFVVWLLEFLARQGERFGNRQIDLDAFYCLGRGPQVRIETLGTFRDTATIEALAASGNAVSIFQPLVAIHRNTDAGMQTYLREALAQVVAGFEGVVWLVTDNIVESGDDPDELDLNAFFGQIKEDPRYRAAHVFAFPYAMDGRQGALAVYGFLVSPEPPDKAVHDYLDRIFFELRQYIPRHRHLKLKDLGNQPLDPELECSARVTGDLNHFSQRGQALRVDYSAAVASLLTQHTVVAGTCVVSAGTFVPAGEDAAAYGVAPLPAGWLQGSEQLLPAIEPGAAVTLPGTLASQGDIALPGMDAASRRAWAASGKPLAYTGKFQIAFTNLGIRFEPERLEEIYGMPSALSVFGINAAADSLPDQSISLEKTLLVFPPPPAGGWIPLVLLLLLLLAALAAVLAVLARASAYRVVVAGEAAVVRLRPCGRFGVRHGDVRLGVLRRGLGRDFDFAPGPDRADWRVERLTTAGLATWRAVPTASQGKDEAVLVTIESLAGGRARNGGASPGGAGTARPVATAGPGPKPGPKPGPARRIPPPKR